MANNIYNNIPDMIKGEYGEQPQPKQRKPLETDFKFEGGEMPDDYNDFYGDGEKITRSERNFNIAVGNDYPVYQHFVKNLPSYRERMAKGEDYRNIINELYGKRTYDDYNPRNIRREYLARMLANDEWLDK